MSAAKAKPAKMQIRPEYLNRLIFFASPKIGNARDLVGRGNGTLFGSAALGGNSALGNGINVPGTTSDGIWWAPANNFYFTGNTVTIICWVRPDTLAAWSTLISVPYRNGSWTNPFASLALQRNSTTTSAQFAYTATGGTNRSCSSSTGFIQVENLTCYAVTRNGSAVAFYRNGVLFSTTTTASSDTSNFDWTNKQGVTVGNHSYSSVGEGLQGVHAQAEIWNVSLSAQQILWRFMHPYGVLQKPRPYGWFVGQPGAAPAGGPFPHYVRRMLSGGLINMSGGVT